MRAVETRALWLKLGSAQVLRDISLTVECGELVAIIGPNGAGKSSLLRVIGGDIPASRGDVKLFERPAQSWSDAELAKRRAFLTQRSNVSLPFLVEEIVAMGRAPHGDEDPKIVDASLEAAAAVAFRGRALTTLSGGEAQRVHVARVLAQIGPQPRGRLLLLDEPIAALDLEHQHSVLAVGRALARRCAAVMVVLHDLNIAAKYADRIIALRDGTMVAEGGPQEVLTETFLRDTFRVRAEVMTGAGGSLVIATHGALR